MTHRGALVKCLDGVYRPAAPEITPAAADVAGNDLMRQCVQTVIAAAERALNTELYNSTGLSQVIDQVLPATLTPNPQSNNRTAPADPIAVRIAKLSGILPKTDRRRRRRSHV